jgi:hypothetical protein
MVAPWRITLAKSKQKNNAPGYIYLFRTKKTNLKKSIFRCRGGMVASWRITLHKSKQRRTCNTTDRSKYLKNFLKFMGGIVAPWTNTPAKSKHISLGVISIYFPHYGRIKIKSSNV